MCDTSTVGCDVTFDLVLKERGRQVLTGVTVYVVSKDAETVYAQGYTDLFDKGIARRGKPIPVSLTVVGVEIPSDAEVEVRAEAVDPLAPVPGEDVPPLDESDLEDYGVWIGPTDSSGLPAAPYEECPDVLPASSPLPDDCPISLEEVPDFYLVK